MGSDSSRFDHVIPKLYNLAESRYLLPDISIDQSLRRYSGLDSAYYLNAYTSQLQSEVVGKGPSYVQSLGSTIASLNSVPNAVGLGALIISLVLDLAIMSVTRNSDSSTLNMLRRVFAEEKASSVRDTMDECMKRLSMYVKETNKVLGELERIEKQLSEQLTRLRNSMLHDDQMSSRSMKYWVNGAAFHSQMLIHAERLKTHINSTVSENQVTSINTVIEHYQSDLQELMKKYKTYKKSTITFYRSAFYCYLWGECSNDCAIKDNELGLGASAKAVDLETNSYSCQFSVDTYVNYMFNTWKEVKYLEGYFLYLKKDIKELILQHQCFSVS